MTTILTINFTADAGSVGLSTGSVGLDGSKFFGPPAHLMGTDLKTSNPVAWAAAQEFLNTGATSGTVVITAS